MIVVLSFVSRFLNIPHLSTSLDLKNIVIIIFKLLFSLLFIVLVSFLFYRYLEKETFLAVIRKHHFSWSMCITHNAMSGRFFDAPAGNHGLQKKNQRFDNAIQLPWFPAGSHHRGNCRGVLSSCVRLYFLVYQVTHSLDCKTVII